MYPDTHAPSYTFQDWITLTSAYPQPVTFWYKKCAISSFLLQERVCNQVKLALVRLWSVWPCAEQGAVKSSWAESRCMVYTFNLERVIAVGLLMSASLLSLSLQYVTWRHLGLIALHRLQTSVFTVLALALLSLSPAPVNASGRTCPWCLAYARETEQSRGLYLSYFEERDSCDFLQIRFFRKLCVKRRGM